MANQKELLPYAGRQGERLMSQPERLERELPEAVRTLVEARTGDAVYVVGPDYSIGHWDEQMESLSGVLSEEALGKPCYEAVMEEGRKSNLSVLEALGHTPS